MADIPWSMSAVLEYVSRGGNEVAEVTSLELAVRAWLDLDSDMQDEAVLVPHEPFQFCDDGRTCAFTGQAIRTLAEHLPPWLGAETPQ